MVNHFNTKMSKKEEHNLMLCIYNINISYKFLKECIILKNCKLKNQYNSYSYL